jgi:hypothetical protein
LEVQIIEEAVGEKDGIIPIHLCGKKRIVSQQTNCNCRGCMSKVTFENPSSWQVGGMVIIHKKT